MCIFYLPHLWRIRRWLREAKLREDGTLSPMLPGLQVAIESTLFTWRLSVIYTPWWILGSSSCCPASLLPAHRLLIQASPGRGSSWAPSVTSCPSPSYIRGSPSAPWNLASGTIFVCIFNFFPALSSGSHPVLMGYFSFLIGFPVCSILFLPHCLHTGAPAVYLDMGLSSLLLCWNALCGSQKVVE